MTDTAAGANGLTWLLDTFAERVPGIRHAIILSNDGLLVARTRNLDRNDADHLSAVAAGFHSLASGAGDHFDCGDVRRTVVDLTRGLLFVMAAGSGARMAVLTEPGADAGVVAYEMSMLVRRMGEHMAILPRYENPPHEIR